MPPLKNQRHERFCNLIVEGKSATDAHDECGYTPNRKNAYRLKTKEVVKNRIVELKEEAARVVTVDLQRLLREYQRLALSSMDNYLKISENGSVEPDLASLNADEWAAVQEITFDDDGVVTENAEGEKNLRPFRRVKNFKLASKARAMNDLAKHFGMFIERLEITGKDGGPIQVDKIERVIVDPSD